MIKVNWDVLKLILLSHGFFYDHFVSLIFVTLFSLMVLLLVSSSLKMALGEGDIPASSLFLLIFCPEPKSRANPKISHLLYADDLVIYCKANLEEAPEGKKCLNQFSEWRGQGINYSKSQIHFSKIQ